MRCTGTDRIWPKPLRNGPTRPGMLTSTRAFCFVLRRGSRNAPRGDMRNSQVSQWSARLAGQSAAEVLAWAAQRFAPRVAFSTGFGPEGCVLVHLIAEQKLPIDVFTLDTGLFFPETLELWHRLEMRYGMRIRAVRPALSVADQAI